VKLGTCGFFLDWQRDDYLKPGAIRSSKETGETFRELLDLTFTADLFLDDSDLSGQSPGTRKIASQELRQGTQVTSGALQKDCEPRFGDNHPIKWLQARGQLLTQCACTRLRRNDDLLDPGLRNR
jgi:hypothetical protein